MYRCGWRVAEHSRMAYGGGAARELAWVGRGQGRLGRLAGALFVLAEVAGSSGTAAVGALMWVLVSGGVKPSGVLVVSGADEESGGWDVRGRRGSRTRADGGMKERQQFLN